ncbi:bifunctional folylpolyglutamate synthase/dihydrofolate synthase [Enterobacter asburiae]|uniref:Bifunctional folylpolyglutamate synthase/dihydrofolate synthase n=1 Tax=Enterobacter asburiae TaxID=61645 RepID=A0A376FLT2_ENTAS|nr:bifunctional folylpolyglutamate synthase/dihydrofolate synthase [Enterobacter asburiae]
MTGQYEVQDNGWRFSDAQGALDNLPQPQVPQPNAATALAALRASGLVVSEQAIPRRYSERNSAGRFQIVSESPRLILDVRITRMRRRISRDVSNRLPKTGARAGGYRYAS